MVDLAELVKQMTSLRLRRNELLAQKLSPENRVKTDAVERQLRRLQDIWKHETRPTPEPVPEKQLVLL